MRKALLILGIVASFIGLGALACGMSSVQGDLLSSPYAGVIAAGAVITTIGISLMGAGIARYCQNQP